MKASTEHTTYRAMVIAGYSYLIIFALFIVSKAILPTGYGGWSNPPIFDFVFLFCVGICLLILSLGYSHFAWTRSAREFVDWYINQIKFGRSWAQWWRRLYPDWAVLWTSRIFAPVGALFGLGLIVYTAIAILRYILN
jgi:hypothetical protein